MLALLRTTDAVKPVADLLIRNVWSTFVEDPTMRTGNPEKKNLSNKNSLASLQEWRYLPRLDVITDEGWEKRLASERTIGHTGVPE